MYASLDLGTASMKLQTWQAAARTSRQLLASTNGDTVVLDYTVASDENNGQMKSSIKVLPFLKSKLVSLSSRQIDKLCKDKHVLVNGNTTYSNSNLYSGYHVQLCLPAHLNLDVHNQGVGIPSDDKDVERLMHFTNALLSPTRNPAMQVLYEDDELAVVCKPAGVHSMPWVNTLQRKLFTFQDALPLLLTPPASDVQDVLAFPTPCHRLDSRVSGCVLVAKTLSSLRLFSEQFANKSLDKVYYAILAGRVDPSAYPNVTKPVRDQAWMVTSVLHGKECQTEVEIVESIPHSSYGYVTFVKLKPWTGRKHQLRQHCALLGCPIVGDELYHELMHITSIEQRLQLLEDKMNKMEDGNNEEEDELDDVNPVEGGPSSAVVHVKKGYGMLLSSTSISFLHPKSSLPMSINMKLPPKFEKFLTKARVAHQWRLDNPNYDQEQSSSASVA